MPTLAKRSGVSVPTIYRYFPTRTDLLRGIAEHADAATKRDPIPFDPDDLRPSLAVFFDARFRVFERLGAIAESPLTWEVRRNVTVPRRRSYVDRIIAHWVPRLGEPERTWLSDILVVTMSSNTAYAFRNYTDCSAEETTDRVNWIIEALKAYARSRSRAPRHKRKQR